jgi:hypothetical protein
MSRYRIVLRGRLSERFESAFEGMALEPGPNQTVLVGDVRDQAHLYGLLDRLRDFGIELVAVEKTDTRDMSTEPGRPGGAGKSAEPRLQPGQQVWLHLLEADGLWQYGTLSRPARNAIPSSTERYPVQPGGRRYPDRRRVIIKSAIRPVHPV